MIQFIPKPNIANPQVAGYFKGNQDEAKTKARLVDIMLCLGISVILFRASFNAAVYAFCENFIPALRSIADRGLFVVEAALLLFCTAYVLMRKPMKSIGIACVYLALIFANFFFFPANRSMLIGISRNYFLFCMPAFILFYNLKNDALFLKFMRAGALLMFACCVFIYFFDDNVRNSAYSMWFSYQLCIPGIYYAYRWFSTFKIRYLLIVAAVLAMILLKGARGPLVCILAFVLIFWFVKILRRNFTARADWKKVLFYAVFIAVGGGAVLILSSGGLLSAVSEINSRTLSTLLDGSFFTYTSGRENIYAASLEAVARHPITGLGMAGDRVVNGSYSHNLFIELIACFGYIFGGLLCIILVYLVIHTVFYTKGNTDLQDILVIFLCLGFVTLLMSTSVFENINFHLFLGVAVRSLSVHGRAPSRHMRPYFRQELVS